MLKLYCSRLANLFMKQKLAAIIAIVILIATVLGFDVGAGSLSFGSSGNATLSSVTAPPHQLHAHRIVCVGDSITEGLADPNNWPYHLKARLDGDWEVVDQGVGGAKTADMLALIDVALNLDPHFVIIMGGINDLANGDVPLATIQANIRAMCTRVESYGAVPVLCTVIPTSSPVAQRDILNAWIAEYANSEGYGLIDFCAVIDQPLNPGYPNPMLMMLDGVHPSAAGYSAMGNAINLNIFTGGR
jgi:lysophospholipase L1-like esterase